MVQVFATLTNIQVLRISGLVTQEKKARGILQLIGEVVCFPSRFLRGTGGPGDACGRIGDHGPEDNVFDRLHRCSTGEVRDGQNEGEEEGKQRVEHCWSVELKSR